jgi:hypothetical protein
MQFGHRECRAAVAATLMQVSAVLREQLHHWHVPSLRSDVERRIAWLIPREIRICAVFQQPPRSDDVVAPAQDVAQRRHAAWNAVGIDVEER